MKILNQIKNYNFAEAKFEELPSEAFCIDPNSLSKRDAAILDAIRFQRKVSKYNGIYHNALQYINNYEFKTINYVFQTRDAMLNSIISVFHNTYPIIQSPGQILKTVYSGMAFTIVFFIFVSFAYYANVNLNLGMSFLTELFA